MASKYNARHNTRKRVAPKSLNSPVTKSQVTSIVHRALSKDRLLKYFDFSLASQNCTAGVGFSIISLVPQGNAQSQRIGDLIHMQHFDMRLSFNAANTDIFSHARFFFFQWKEDTSIGGPSALDIFTASGPQSVYTMLTYETRATYHLLTRDHLLNFTGTATDPTPTSQHDIIRRVKLNNIRLDFNLGATSGFNHIYFTNYGDSLIAPFPVYNLVTRLWYYDTE
jgi:hypothetical protein